MEFLTNLKLETLFTPEILTKAAIIAAYWILGTLLIRVVQSVIKRLLKDRVSPQFMLILLKALSYTCYLIILLLTLAEAGVNLTALLGAAGIVGVAMGIASRNSLGNIISGLFLIGDKAFEVGDVIRVEEITGTIHSIDLLSVKLKTFDNLFVRIPHEKIINVNLTNLTHFPIRRLDLDFHVPYHTDLELARGLALKAAAENDYALNEPEAMAVSNGIDEYGIKILVGIWFVKTDYVPLKNSYITALQGEYKTAGISFAGARFIVSDPV